MPLGGETFRSGSIRNIRWLSAVPQSEGDSTVDIQISLDGPSGPWSTIVSDIPNNGCYQWLVDAGGSENCRIKVIVTTSKSSVSAISANDFTIFGFSVDAHGPYQGFIGESIQFTGSAENGNPPYIYHWDFGDGKTSNVQNPTHSYDEEENYTVTLTVTDDDDITISDSTWALIKEENKPPNAPKINGKTSGKPGVEYEYSFMSTDPNNDDLSYQIDWDDGIEEVIGTFPSGTEAYKNHTWLTQGTYKIRAKAEDSYGLESAWTTLTVTMPRNKLLVNSLINKYINQFSNLFATLKILFCQYVQIPWYNQ
jgi:PKD repeat protein